MCGNIETERERTFPMEQQSSRGRQKDVCCMCPQGVILQLAQRNFWKPELEASMHSVEERAGEETSRDREFRPLRRREENPAPRARLVCGRRER